MKNVSLFVVSTTVSVEFTIEYDDLSIGVKRRFFSTGPLKANTLATTEEIYKKQLVDSVSFNTLGMFKIFICSPPNDDMLTTSVPILKFHIIPTRAK